VNFLSKIHSPVLIVDNRREKFVMNIELSKKLRRAIVLSLTWCAAAGPASVLAEADWYSFTMDNDYLTASDNGYTNGVYFTWIDTPDNNKPEPGFLARAMLWSLPDDDAPVREFGIGTIGQTMVTPDDIEQDPPVLPPDDLPYGGLLYYNDSYLAVREKHSDRISVTIGVIGEYSFAEESQEFVHKVIGADEPCCWDSQLDDEIVFQIARGRVWRSWVSDSGNTDFLLGADAALGTISSTLGTSFMVRYGAGLKQTYATALLASGRTANPIAADTGWYVYAGARAGYLANQIFLDGNTFDDDDDNPIDYDEERFAITLGLAYSWKDWSLTFAINDQNVAENSDHESADEYLRFGTFTLAWRAD
jgi:hypothetical protein